jgi:hypothetical protein
MLTSFRPILITLSSTSLRGTFIFSKYARPEMDEVGVTTNPSVTMNDIGPLVKPPEMGDLGSTNFNVLDITGDTGMGNILFLSSN